MPSARVTVLIEYQAQPDQLATAIAEIERLIAPGARRRSTLLLTPVS